MRKMGVIQVWLNLLVGLLLFSMGGMAYASVTAGVSTNPVIFGEAFQLILKSDDSIDDIDLTALQSDFEVQGQSKSSSVTMINGQVESSHTLTITLMAQRLGQLTIPAFVVANEQTQPIRLEVKKATATSGMTDQLFIKTRLSSQSPYVQQQLLLTIQIYSALGFNQAKLSAVTLNQKDSTIEKIGDNKQYSERLNGVLYDVIELKYAIFSQYSGRLDIAPLQFTTEVLNRTNRRRDPFFDRFFQRQGQGKIVRAVSDKIVVDIQPAKHKRDWLPANQLSLSENWTDQTKQLTVGESFTRTIMLFADGLMASQLPEITLSLPQGIKQYPNQPQLKNQSHEKGLTGSRQEKFAIMASVPGDYVLPAIEIPWWNTQTNTAEIARLPERRLSVIANKEDEVIAPPVASPIVPPSLPDQPERLVYSQDSMLENTLKSQGMMLAGYWPWISLGLAIGWLMTLIYMVLRLKKSNKKARVEVEKVAKVLPSSLKDIENAINQQDFKPLQQHLISWANNHCDQADFKNMGQVAACLGGEASIQLHALEQALYSSNKQDWDAHLLLAALTNLPKQSSAKPSEKSELRPLHPI